MTKLLFYSCKYKILKLLCCHACECKINKLLKYWSVFIFLAHLSKGTKVSLYEGTESTCLSACASTLSNLNISKVTPILDLVWRKCCPALLSFYDGKFSILKNQGHTLESG